MIKGMSELDCKLSPQRYKWYALIQCLCSDDGDGALGEGISFLDFCPDWKEVNLWDKWVEYATKCFNTGM